MDDAPLDSRLTRVEWLNTPDKYRGPKLFGDLAKEAGELVFTNPGGGRWVLIR